MTAAHLVVDTAKDIKTLTAALDGATALVVRCPAERYKAVATAMAKGVYPALVDLELIISDFDPAEEVGAAALTAKASAALWQALPSLKRLRLRGHALCRSLDHDVLERLEVEGYAFGAGVVPPAGACPRLHTLRWAFAGDEHGVALEPSAIQDLWTEPRPALEHLDLCGADVDGSLLDVKSFLTAPLLKQLKTLGLPSASTPGWRTVLTALPTLSSLLVQDAALAGLDKRIVVVAASADAEDAGSAHSDSIDLYGLDDAKLAKAKLLSHTSSLRQLTLRWHWLEAAGAKIVAQVVAAHAELETLNLNNPATGGWDAEALAAFVDSIDAHQGLKVLHLRNNSFEGAGKALAALLDKLPRLEVLELSQTDLKAGDLTAVLPAIARLKHLRVLLMGGLDRSEAGAECWQALSSSSLQTLELWTTPFKEHWPLVLHELGKRLPALRTLSVEAGQLSTAATKALAAGLRGHQQLRSLQIEMAPTTAAYEALKTVVSSVALTNLILEEEKKAVQPNETCDSAAIGILGQAKVLTHLTIDIDDADTAKHRALAEALTTLPTLRALSGWHPDEEDPAVLRGLEDLLASSSVRIYQDLDGTTTNALLERNAIEALWIDSGYDLEEKLVNRAAALKVTTSLHTLVLLGGELKSDRAKVLVGALTDNTSIKALTLSMAMKASAAKDLIKRISRLGRVETMTFAVSEAFEVSPAEQQELAATAKGNMRVVFVEPFQAKNFDGLTL